MLRCLCGSPSIPLSFSLAAVLPRRNALALAAAGKFFPLPGIHRLRRGLPGYLILFAPHAFAPERQCLSGKPPSPLVFLLISAHFTATPGILLASPALERSGLGCTPGVGPRPFTSHLKRRLRTLYAQ